MITPDDFRSVWRWGSLKKYPYESMMLLDIPEEAKIFLSEAGLPERHPLFGPLVNVVQLNLEGSSTDKWPFMAKVAGTSGLRAFATWERLPFMGLDMDFGLTELFCIEEHTGAIYHVDGYVDRVRLINSSLPQYAECMAVFLTLIESLGTETDLEYELLEAAVEEAKNRLDTIDSIPLKMQDSFWTLTLDDIYISY